MITLSHEQKRQNLVDLAKLMNPSSWNLFVDQKGRKLKRGILNIWLWIHDYNKGDNAQDEWIGKVHTPQRCPWATPGRKEMGDVWHQH
jgi:hypothetical protein